MRVAFEPFRNVVVEILLGPDHPGESLPLNEASVRVLQITLHLVIVCVCLRTPGVHYSIEDSNGSPAEVTPQTRSGLDRAASGNIADNVSGRLCSTLGGIHSGRISLNDILMKRILKITVYP